MQRDGVERFEEAVFRANAAFELLLFDRLPLEQQQLLNDLQQDTNCYGVLRSLQHPEPGIRAVDRDTALLFFTLQTPGHIPTYVKSQLGEDYCKTMLSFVLDDIFEIEWCGAWISGVEAYEKFYTEPLLPAVQGTIARLSLEAIQYAQALELYDCMKLSMRLYGYNRLPLCAHWRQKFSTSDSVAEYLGLQTHAKVQLLKRQWIEVRSSASSSGWFAWSARDVQSTPDPARFVYKLYISPACACVRDAFQTTIEVLEGTQAAHFKIGKDVYGLLRPDKFVVYFASMEACQNAATLLMRKLEGLPAHGVPFSAEIGGDGLLSWGIDPPGEEQTFSGRNGESWRLWVTNRLAAALLNAQTGRSNRVEPWQFALGRLRLDGVNTETWTPQVYWQAKE